MQQTFISNSPDLVTQQYITLLEKTNQQLSLWSNPYGVLITILSTLFTVLTVVAAVIIWRQSREQKEAFREALTNYENGLQENLKKIGSEAESKIQSFIDIKTTEINNLSGDTKKQAKKILDDLKKEKDSISSRVQFSSVQTQPLKFGGTTINTGAGGPSTIGVWGNGGAATTVGVFCNNCGAYNPNANHNSFGVLFVPGATAASASFCSKCGYRL